MSDNIAKKESFFIFEKSPAPATITPALAIDLVDACNLACSTCVRGFRRMKNRLAQMDFSLYKQIIKKAAGIGFERIYLYNWTEPFLCRDLHHYTQEIKKVGDLGCQLSSNLSFRKIPHLLPALEYCDTLIVSVSGFTQPVYRINHRGGNIELVKRQLDIIADAKANGKIGADIIIRYFNFPHSRHEYPLFEKFANDRDFKILLWHGGGEPEKNSPKSQKFWDYIIDGKIQPDRIDKILTLGAQKICYTALNPFNLDYKGDAYLCCTAPNCARTKIGNFLEDDFHALMYRRFSHFLCKNCSAFKPVDIPAHYASWMAKGLLQEYGILPAKLQEIGEEMKAINQLAGREVYFYGHGAMLRRKMHEYSNCKPIFILSDLDNHPDNIGGIPVLRPEEALDDSRPLPIIIFAGADAAKHIQNKIKSKWPGHNEIYCSLPS